jgi:replication factor A1
MISMPYTDIVARIKEEKSISDGELDMRIKKKMDQLSGLISKEGAAYIVANDLGVKLIQTSGLIKIKNILAGMRSVETAGKVMRKFDLVTFEREGKHGKVASFQIADETGQIRVTAWHEQTELLNTFKEGDTVRIVNGLFRLNQGQKEIHLNERSKIIVNPSDIVIKGVAAPVAQAEQVRKKISELVENDQNVEVFGTVVQLFDPRYFEQCPVCRKRPVQRDDGFMCEEHGLITPNYGYVVNLILDDGSDNIRIVLFREQMQQLFRKRDDELQQLRTTAAEFEPLKNELLGEQIIIAGRVVKNTMFERLEMIANRVNRNVNPEAEIQRLEAAHVPSVDDL